MKRIVIIILSVIIISCTSSIQFLKYSDEQVQEFKDKMLYQEDIVYFGYDFPVVDEKLLFEEVKYNPIDSTLIISGKIGNINQLTKLSEVEIVMGELALPHSDKYKYIASVVNRYTVKDEDGKFEIEAPLNPNSVFYVTVDGYYTHGYRIGGLLTGEKPKDVYLGTHEVETPAVPEKPIILK